MQWAHDFTNYGPTTTNRGLKSEYEYTVPHLQFPILTTVYNSVVAALRRGNAQQWNGRNIAVVASPMACKRRGPAGPRVCVSEDFFGISNVPLWVTMIQNIY